MLRLAERDVVDLTGRQLLGLREENDLLRKQLGEWYANAAANEALGLMLHRLAVRIAGSRRQLGFAGLERALKAEAGAAGLGLGLCRVLARADMAVARGQGRALLKRQVVRSARPLPEAAAKLGRRRWRAYLHVPLGSGGQLKGMVVFASDDAKAFPPEAHNDYVLRLAELLAAAITAGR